jgi:predicted O-linked N-acetylglucosamine transferase (SPINDLY family)
VPVVTLPGVRLPSRVSAAFMAWIHPALIASNLLEYEDIVVALATRPALLQDAKERVGRGIVESRLFDTREWSRSVTRASAMMWEVRLHFWRLHRKLLGCVCFARDIWSCGRVISCCFTSDLL